MNDNRVKTNQGALKGVLFATENDFEYFGFLGVPFAKPPVADLRFKAPQSVEPWDGERDATVDESICPQINMMTGSVSGKEDCLYLNVYTPKIVSTPTQTKLPVMVYIHGGGFAFGDGTLKDDSGPDYLIERGVIVVTINYRLGIFGFLSLDIPEAQGNMGLKDQVQALKWVQENIAAFGGDASNVTIFGISAGAASVDYLLVSPMARNLFHKAIVQSGAAINHWARSQNNLKLPLRVAKHMGYKGGDDDSTSLCNFFLEKQTEELVRSSFEIIQTIDVNGVYFGFTPTIEREFEGTQAFLTKNPYTLMKSGDFSKVPTIRGFCSLEGLLMHAMKPYRVEELVVDKNLARFLPYELSDSQEVNNTLKKIYVDSSNPEDDRDAFALKFFSDLDFTGGVWACGKAMIKHDVPLYMYKFTYDGGMNHFKRIFGLMRPGTAHGDDTAYVMRLQDIIQHRTETDKKVCNHFSRLWTNFSKSGNPNPIENEGATQWLPFTKQQKNYLVIDESFTLRCDYEPRRMEFFEELYDKYEK